MSQKSNYDEIDELAKPLQDKSRKVKRVGSQLYVPQKFDEEGEILDKSSFDVKKHLSRLNLNDLRFLKLWRDNKWNDEEVLAKAGLPADQVKRTFKKLAYFKTEDARIRALASEATQERVLAKDMENVETGELNDSQHKSLDRVAKILGAFKTSASVNIQNNIFNMPRLSPEAEAKLKEFADAQADIVDAVIEGEIAA